MEEPGRVSATALDGTATAEIGNVAALDAHRLTPLNPHGVHQRLSVGAPRISISSAEMRAKTKIILHVMCVTFHHRYAFCLFRALCLAGMDPRFELPARVPSLESVPTRSNTRQVEYCTPPFPGREPLGDSFQPDGSRTAILLPDEWSFFVR
ncbi:hypothetical protein BC830DRAFT_876394 [Chytriomyces sp. MP71]|nr:hypothetical protein BC830DRAFT_876394 [Chytriomyces sp. MP71]